MNTVQLENIQEFANDFLLAEKLSNSKFLITGSTGLIGSNLVHCLLSLHKRISIYAPVRNVEKAKNMFTHDELTCIQLIECDIIEYDYNQLDSIDYIVHCAAPTASKFFVEYPVETFNTIIDGTKVLLEYARTHKVKGFVYLSSLEVYGEIHDDSIKVFEKTQGTLDLLSVRSSYPMAKRAAETLCHLYFSEYCIPVKIARLTQTTGAGISKNDSRVIAQFARCAANGDDIILHTTGESARPYCYTIDAISALLYILLKGENGEAFNVANEDTYISVKELAYFIKNSFNENINVRFERNSNMGYAPTTKLDLSSQKLLKLGWKPKYDLHKTMDCLIRSIIEDYE